MVLINQLLLRKVVAELVMDTVREKTAVAAEILTKNLPLLILMIENVVGQAQMRRILVEVAQTTEEDIMIILEVIVEEIQILSEKRQSPAREMYQRMVLKGGIDWIKW
mmetsp:Transcript_12828/g.25643  ORF Transcript_12828/g.25643 Transcript_12828/m.25643 type:complete len:108 (+) Transcript_12828:1526-1849(+)